MDERTGVQYNLCVHSCGFASLLYAYQETKFSMSLLFVIIRNCHVIVERGYFYKAFLLCS